MLLSIAIPAYARPKELRHALNSLIRQILLYEGLIEILVVDDASPDDPLGFVADLARRYGFIRYTRLEENIGLERNLISCAKDARGEYLWIFGDDDFLETADALDEIVSLLRSDRYDVLVLNRTRRSSDLSTLMTENWMRLNGGDRDFSGLREFCLEFGFISVIGFITANIFRRVPFAQVDSSRYLGTMYPQLGSMLEAFHDKPVRLIAHPVICHRTLSQDEKSAALGAKASESDFMNDVRRRNGLYFSHPFIEMISELVELGAFKREDIAKIRENTVIDGPLIDFLLNCVDASLAYPERFSRRVWARSLDFLSGLGLTPSQSKKLATLSYRREKACATISVITPSFNQGEFLEECLRSVRDQTHKPLEHFVFDPGSTDNSRDIARKFAHVTLFAEPDEGQSDALNKGFSRATGDVIAWLNSDDVFASPEVFAKVLARFNQADAPDIVYGKGVYIDEAGHKLRDAYINKDPSSLHWRLQQEDGIMQPAVFMRRSLIKRIGALTGSRHYCMDYEYWIRCVQAKVKFAFVDENFALARYHSSNKTYGQRGNSYAEVCDMLMTHFGYVNHVWLKLYAAFLSEGWDGVLAHAGNTEIGDQSQFDAIYRQLLSDYNGGQLVYSMLEEKAAEKGAGDTLREMKRLGVGASTPCKLAPLDAQAEPNRVLYNVGPRRWSFDAMWKEAQIAKAHTFLRRQIKERRSDICVIVGNGPSLKRSKLELLKGHDVIISNNAFLDRQLSGLATYYTAVNYLVAEQSAHHINRLEGVKKILPYWISYCLNEGRDTYFIDAVGRAEFSKDIFCNASWRHTVTFFNLHIAFGLGYQRVILIGFDHAYKQDAGVKEGDIILSDATDENHFDGRYFQGKKWQAADVKMMEAMYLLAKTAYEEEGREIINATVGGALELFPRQSLEEALKGTPIIAGRRANASASM